MDNNPNIWDSNKLKMVQIMKSAPIAGIYLNQDRSYWDTFFEFYTNFLNM